MANQTPVPITDSKDVWKRGLFMLLFAIAFGIGQAVLNAIAIVQFLWLLFTREPKSPLVRFGNSLSVGLAMLNASKPAPPMRNPGFELSPRVRLSNIVMRKPAGVTVQSTAAGTANRR
jgi:hypothetical protein